MVRALQLGDFFLAYAKHVFEVQLTTDPVHQAAQQAWSVIQRQRLTRITPGQLAGKVRALRKTSDAKAALELLCQQGKLERENRPGKDSKAYLVRKSRKDADVLTVSDAAPSSAAPVVSPQNSETNGLNLVQQVPFDPSDGSGGLPPRDGSKLPTMAVSQAPLSETSDDGEDLKNPLETHVSHGGGRSNSSQITSAPSPEGEAVSDTAGPRDGRLRQIRYTLLAYRAQHVRSLHLHLPDVEPWVQEFAESLRWISASARVEVDNAVSEVVLEMPAADANSEQQMLDFAELCLKNSFEAKHGDSIYIKIIQESQILESPATEDTPTVKPSSVPAYDTKDAPTQEKPR